MIPIEEFTDVIMMTLMAMMTLVTMRTLMTLMTMMTLMTLFSVTRRSRSDVSHLLPESLDVSIDLTDVTLVSDDTNRRVY